MGAHPQLSIDMTIPEVYFRMASLYSSNDAISYRSDARWVSVKYDQLSSDILSIASALINRGMARGDRVCILSENRYEYYVTELAVMSAGGVVVPLYTNSTPGQIAYVINHSEAKFLFSTEHEPTLKKLNSIKNDLSTSIKAIFFKAVGTKKKGLTFDGLIAEGKSSKLRETLLKNLKDITSDDLATIIYTSGTSGDPKGVMLSHRNIISNSISAMDALPITSSSVNLSILPLSHAFEKTCGFFIFLFSGAKICLLDNLGSLAKTLKEVRPTHLIGVPKLYESIHDQVCRQMSKRSLPVRSLFFSGLRSAIKAIRNEATALDRIKKLAAGIIFRSIKRNLGGRLELLISGGSALPVHVAEFFTALKIPIVEGYGLTEASPVVSVNRVGNSRIGTVGTALKGVDVKVASDGELLVKGYNIMKGYYKDGKATQSVIAKGWLYTGDIARLDPEGFISIVGRKKELIVTRGGKNISPVKLESALLSSPLIKQAVVIGDNRDFMTAIIVPDGRIDPEARERIDAHIKEINKGLSNYEKIRRYKVSDREFTIDSGELTPTFKLKRKIIEKNFKDIIGSMYGS